MSQQLYVFEVTPQGVVINTPHDFFITKQERMDEAVVLAKKIHSGKNITCIGSLPFAKIAGEDLPVLELPPLSPEEQKKQFVNGLRLLADKYVEEKDRAVLIKIIEGVK